MTGWGAVRAQRHAGRLRAPLAGLACALLATAAASAPGTSAPGTSAPGTSAPGTSAPGTSAPGASAPDAGPPPAARFVAVDDVVEDQATGLVWQRCSVGQRWEADLGCVGLAKKMWFSEARALEAGGWRLPRLDELRAIVDVRRNAMADVQAFPDAPASWYWAVDVRGQATAWGVSCDQGGNDICDRGNARAVRLVRPGPYRPWSGK